MSVNTELWVKSAVVRAVKTICQTAVGMIGTAALIAEVNWLHVLSASALSGLISILTSLAGLPEVGLTQENSELKQRMEDEVKLP